MSIKIYNHTLSQEINEPDFSYGLWDWSEMIQERGWDCNDYLEVMYPDNTIIPLSSNIYGLLKQRIMECDELKQFRTVEIIDKMNELETNCWELDSFGTNNNPFRNHANVIKNIRLNCHEK